MSFPPVSRVSSSSFSDEDQAFAELDHRVQKNIERQWAMLDLCGSARQSRMPLRHCERVQERTIVDRNRVIYLQTEIGNTLRKIGTLRSYLQTTKNDKKALEIYNRIEELQQALKGYRRNLQLCDPRGYAAQKKQHRK